MPWVPMEGSQAAEEGQSSRLAPQSRPLGSPVPASKQAIPSNALSLSCSHLHPARPLHPQPGQNAPWEHKG